jgi:hypothetical protein
MYIEKLKADFGAMDVDNSGFVTGANLQEMASQTNYILSKEELDQTIKSMDSDGDGRISIEEFVASAVRKNVSCIGNCFQLIAADSGLFHVSDENEGGLLSTQIVGLFEDTQIGREQKCRKWNH